MIQFPKIIFSQNHLQTWLPRRNCFKQRCFLKIKFCGVRDEKVFISHFFGMEINRWGYRLYYKKFDISLMYVSGINYYFLSGMVCWEVGKVI